MMALEHENLAHSFQNDQTLQKLVLADVRPTGKTLGTGSYGHVEEVLYCHAVCAGKMMHMELFHTDNEGVEELVRKYQRECRLMADLRHPNITQFLGLCFLPGTDLPALVMERMEMSLDDLLEVPQLPLSLKCSILTDVTRGLVYLHNKEIIHRDLTSKNVLLTPSLVAKITDLGNSRFIDITNQSLTRCPGTAVYMPPEATDGATHYTTSLDIFSFGHLALYVFIQVFPKDLRAKTYLNPDNSGGVIGLTELERRGEYISRLETLMERISVEAIDLVKECLHNDSAQRPGAGDCLRRLKEITAMLEENYSSSFGKVDITRIKLEKEIVAKDKRIQMLERLKDRVTQEKDEQDEQLREKTWQLEEVSTQLQEKTRSLAETEERSRTTLEALDSVHRQNSALQRNLERTTASKDDALQQVEDKIRECEGQREELQKCISCQDELLEDLALTTQNLEKKEKERDHIEKERDHVRDRYSQASKLLQERTTKLEETTRELAEKKAAMEDKCRELEAANHELEVKETDLQEVFLQLVSHSGDSSRQSMSDGSFMQSDVSLNKESKEINEETLVSPERIRTLPLARAINLTDWKSVPNIPLGVCGYVQCVVVQGVLYLGGGWSSDTRSDIVMRFRDNTWSSLPYCLRERFSMTDLNNKLVLVGGKSNKIKALPKNIKVLDGQQKWSEDRYPDMPNGRYDCSAVSHGGVLAVTGGWSRTTSNTIKLLNTISLLDTNVAVCSWKSARVRLPVCCHSMKSVMVGDKWYLMGGMSSASTSSRHNCKETAQVFCVSFPELQREGSLVKEIEGLGHFFSTPLSYGDSLYAVGGKMDGEMPSDQIAMLSGNGCDSAASKGSTAAVWTQVGALPQGAWNYVCAVINTGLVVTGGELSDEDWSTKSYLAPPSGTVISDS